jgi:hypothetical protein
MGLIGGMARTAVVAGTATAVSNRVSRRQAGRWSRKEEQQAQQQGSPQQGYPQQGYPPQQSYPPQQGYPQQGYAPQQAAVEPEDSMAAKLEQLKQLGDLKAQGVLTGAEFEQQKARILAS